MNGKLTKRMVDAAQPSDKDQFLWDAETKGFGLKITPRGKRVFVFQYWSPILKNTRKRITLGDYGTLTVDQARAAARQYLGQVAKREDPAKELKEGKRQARDETVEQVSGIYLTEARAKMKPRSFEEYDRAFRRHIVPAIGKVPVVSLTTRDVATLHHSLHATPYQANRTIQYLRAFLNWAEARGYRPEHSNPCARLQRFREESRERFLNQGEMMRLEAALKKAEDEGIPPAPSHRKHPLGMETAKHRPKSADRPIPANPYVVGAIRFLMLSGWREREALTLRWDEVDLQRGVATLPSTKSGKSYRPLGTPAIALLNRLPRLDGCPWVFPGARAGQPLREIQRTWYAARHEAGLDEVRLHDLRHTFASFGAGSGQSLQLIGALLGHSRVETTQRYAHLTDDARRIAADGVSGAIENAMNGTTTAVTPLQVQSRRRTTS